MASYGQTRRGVQLRLSPETMTHVALMYSSAANSPFRYASICRPLLWLMS